MPVIFIPDLKPDSQITQRLFIGKTNGYNISVGPSIFLNKHVALEFLLGYKQTKVKDISDNKTSTFNTALGLQVHLGKIKTKAKV